MRILIGLITLLVSCNSNKNSGSEPESTTTSASARKSNLPSVFNGGTWVLTDRFNGNHPSLKVTTEAIPVLSGYNDSLIGIAKVSWELDGKRQDLPVQMLLELESNEFIVVEGSSDVNKINEILADAEIKKYYIPSAPDDDPDVTELFKMKYIGDGKHSQEVVAKDGKKSYCIGAAEPGELATDCHGICDQRICLSPEDGVTEVMGLWAIKGSVYVAEKYVSGWGM